MTNIIRKDQLSYTENEKYEVTFLPNLKMAFVPYLAILINILLYPHTKEKKVIIKDYFIRLF